MTTTIIKTTGLFLALYIFCTGQLFAQQESQEELKINFQIRPRAEIRNGLYTPILEGQKPASFIAQRSRVGLMYAKDQRLRIGFSAQGVTTWGNDPQVQLTANDISLYEAWAQFYFSKEWSVKAGRQVLSYDDERILGALDWNNAGRKHDAALIKFGKENFKADAGLAFNQNSEKVTSTFFNSSTSQPYKSMQYLWMKSKISKAVSFSGLAMNLDFQNSIDSTMSHLQTLGGNLFYKNRKWDLSGTYYFQLQERSKNFQPSNTHAWMAAAKVDYSFNKNFSATIGSDYLTGQENQSVSKTTFFNPLYGTHHKFYGFMDYFYLSSAHNNKGLWDSYINLNVTTSQNLNMQLALHHFETAADISNYEGKKASNVLGNEADLTLNYKIMTDVRLSGGYSQMFADKSMRYVKNVQPGQQMKDIQNWVWFSVNINPEIIIFQHKTSEAVGANK